MLHNKLHLLARVYSTLEFLIIGANFCTHTRKNEIITCILLLVQQKRKHVEMAFLTSRSVTKHIPYPYGVESTARDAVMVGIPTSESHKLHKSTITSLARCQANAGEFATKVCFSLFDGSEVMASGTKRKLCSVLCLGNLRTCLVYRYRYTYIDRS